MTYEELRYSSPKGIAKKNKKIRKMGPKQVLIFFGIAMLIFVFIGPAIQYALGMIGVVITELYLLGASLLYVKWTGHPFRKVFPIRKPKLSALLGTLVIWIGAYMLLILSNMWLMALDPSFTGNGDAEVIMGADLSWFILFVIVSIVPAICEEAMHRGVIQYGLAKKIRNPWLMAVVIGLIFGFFHLDGTKFIATGILGAAMGWIMYQTGNMVYSSLLHFVHNGTEMIILLAAPGLAVFPGTASFLPFAAGLSDGEAIAMVCISAGVTTIVLGILIPFLLYFGNWLLLKDIAPRRVRLIPADPGERKRLLKKMLLTICAFAAFGFFLILLGIVNF